MEDAIYEACEISVKFEFDFIDAAFEMGNVEGLKPRSTKEFY
jgi:hypothetical protein